MIHIGIDPGVSGAIAIIDGEQVTLLDVPTRKATRGDAYLPAEMADLLRPYSGRAFVVLEEARPPMVAREKGSGNITSAFKIGQGYGLWEGALAGLQISYEPVAAGAWKKAIGLPAGADKKASRAKAQALFPALAAELAKKRPDFAEALLIAEFARRRSG